MTPLHKVSIKTGSVARPLNAQAPHSIYPYGFPFTLNPTMGCSFACKFCFSAKQLRQNIETENREHFFNESTIRLNIADSINKELIRLSALPQYLKRVQINETSDYYLSEVLKELEDQGRDVMLEILQIFQDHWNSENKWMLHILTKSHLIEKHLDKLKEMKEMIQIEISFSTPYENQLRDLELYTPTIKKRLETIEKLSKEGIFVRVMAMPFNGDVPELNELKKITFNAGARALKNKALNYFNWIDVKNISFDNLVQYKLPQTGSRNDTIISLNHMIKSGEDYLENGKTKSVDILMPSEKAWDAMSKFQGKTSLQTLNKIDMGYDELNDVDWVYIKSKVSSGNPSTGGISVKVTGQNKSASKSNHQLTLEQDICSRSLKDNDAKNAMIDYDTKYSNHNYDSTPCKSIFELKNEKYVGHPVKVYGYISDTMQTQPLVFFDNRYTVSGVQISDLQDDVIDSTVFEIDRFASQLQAITKKSTPYIFTGTILSIFSAFRREYIFYIKGIEENVTPLEQINFDPSEIKDLNNKYQQAEKYGLRKYIKDQLIKNLGIKGLSKATELDKALDFIILQSFSRGLSAEGRYSNRLHSLVIGSPAVGKKLLTKSALLLNPVSEELSSSTRKITPAGLVGNVVSTGYGPISKPGYLPKASGGVVCIQDFHEIAKKSDNSIYPVLSKVMEDGEAIDSTSGRTTHQAITSIHLDMNKLSQVKPVQITTAFKDIRIPLNIISRFDFIIDIPPDIQRQIEVTLEMAKGKKTLGTSLTQSKKPEWERELQVFVAYAQTYFRQVDILDQESEEISDRLKKILKDNELKTSLGEHFSSMMTRLQISVEKMIKAIACSEQAPKVLKKHIDEAFSLVDYKINFLKALDIASFTTISSTKKPGKEIRQEFILKEFEGKVVSVNDVVKKIKDELDVEIVERTIRRDLNEMDGVTKPKHGYYKIPDN